MTNMARKLTLHDCVDRGDLDMLTRLLGDGWPVDRENKYGQTALCRSAELGNTNIVKVLLSRGADVNIKDIIHGDTPLHKSAQSGKKDIVKLLIQHGADVDPVDWVGDTPLKLAELRGHGDIVDILKQAKRGQASDGRKWGIFQRIFGYSSSTKKISIQSSDGKGQVTKVKYEDKEVRSHVAGAVCTSETERDETFGKVKVTRQKGSQGPKKREPVTKSAETSSSYLTTSEADVCTSPGLSFELRTLASPSVSAPLPVTASQATSTSPLLTESSLTSTSSRVTASQTSALSPAGTASSQTPTPTSSSTITASASSQPAPNPIDEVTQCAHKLIRAVKDKKLSGSGEEYDGVYPDDNSFDVPREHMGGNVIVIDQKTENHYHKNYYNHCPNCTCKYKQTKCEEVRVETSESLNVSVGSTQYGLLHPPRGDDHDNRETRGEEKDEGAVDVGRKGKSYRGIQAKTLTESTSLLSTTSTLSQATASTSTSASTTTSTAADEIRRRLESQAGDLEKMVQSCVTGGGLGQPQSNDLGLLHHGGVHVPVNLNFIYQPKHVEVWNTKQVNCEKAEVETAEMMPVNSTCTFNYAAQKSSDDEDEENTDDGNSEDDKEIYVVENGNNDFLAGDL